MTKKEAANVAALINAAEIRGERAGLEKAIEHINKFAASHRKSHETGCGIHPEIRLSDKDRKLHQWAAEVLEDESERIRAFLPLSPEK